MTMAESLKDKAKDAGHKLSEEATRVGHEIGEKLGESKKWVKGEKVEDAADAAKKKIHEATK
jgi:hypothetical protein